MMRQPNGRDDNGRLFRTPSQDQHKKEKRLGNKIMRITLSRLWQSILPLEKRGQERNRRIPSICYTCKLTISIAHAQQSRHCAHFFDGFRLMNMSVWGRFLAGRTTGGPPGPCCNTRLVSNQLHSLVCTPRTGHENNTHPRPRGSTTITTITTSTTRWSDRRRRTRRKRRLLRICNGRWSLRRNQT